MKTKLLKKLRKEAHDQYRIAPCALINDEIVYYIESLQTFGGISHWRSIPRPYYSTLAEAIKDLKILREKEFESIACQLIYSRKVEREYRKVEKL